MGYSLIIWVFCASMTAPCQTLDPIIYKELKGCHDEGEQATKRILDGPRKDWLKKDAIKIGWFCYPKEPPSPQILIEHLKNQEPK